eukprot:2702874-Rhodomonas_salina.1
MGRKQTAGSPPPSPPLHAMVGPATYEEAKEVMVAEQAVKLRTKTGKKPVRENRHRCSAAADCCYAERRGKCVL